MKCPNCKILPHCWGMCCACFRVANRLNQRKVRARRRQLMNAMGPELRICIDCNQLFTSIKGINLCRPCHIRAITEATDKTLMKLPLNKVKAEFVHTILYLRYGHAYKATVRPKIPLSTLGVFETTGRKR